MTSSTATVTSATFVSKTDSAIAQLKTELTNLQRRYGDLHRRTENERRTHENEMKRKFQMKFDALREKLQNEKQREIDNLLANVKRDYEQRLTTATQINNREMRRRHQATIFSSTTGKKQQPEQDCLAATTTKQDIVNQQQKTKNIERNNEIRERLVVMQDQLSQSEKLLKEKDEEIANLKHAKTVAAHGLAVESQRHIRSLLEEVRQKERQINKLEHSLKSVEHQLIRATSGVCNNFLYSSCQGDNNSASETTTSTTNTVMLSGKMTPALSASKSVMGTSLNGIARDEYDREKQRWSIRLSDLESQLKFSEQSNAELSQSKADLIRRIKELEKTQKVLQESFKKLTEKHKTMCQDFKQSEEKFRQCYEENINMKQNLEKVTLECNKMKEKRVRCDKQEEVEKLKQQSLEYCKTISALKQTNIEKDRRLDLLHQKFKRIKHRSRSKTVDFLFSDTEDTKSWIGSDHSVSSASLNTIAEDWAELPREELESNYRQLARNYLELQRVHLSLSRCHVEQQQQQQQQSSSVSTDSLSDLSTKYREALKKIEHLEKFVSTTNALGADAEWAQEKLKLTTTVENLQTKIEDLNACREKLQCEVQELKEQNELLEFQVLENQQCSSEVMCLQYYKSSSSSAKVRRVCDRSSSTSEDEGVYSVDSFDDSTDNSEHKEFSLEDLKIRFTLLKHRKELRAEDKIVIAQVKNVWETLHQKHSQCNANEMEWQMKFREIESYWKQESDSLKQQLEELSVKKKKRLKFKEIQNELENACQTSADLQRINAELEKCLNDCKTELEKVQYLLKISEESKQREQKHAEDMRKQIDNLKQGRMAEMELLENATNYKAKELDAYRRKEDELEAQLAVLKSANENLHEEFDSNFHRLLDEERSKYERQLEEQRQVETKLKQQLQSIQDSCRSVEQKFQDSLKTVRRLEKQELKTSTEMNDLLLVNDRLTKTVEQMHENQISLNKRCIELETAEQTAKQEFDQERQRLIVDHAKQLEEANSNLERIRLNFEEKSAENTKLQRQLNQLKSYSKQLEAQFEIQLQTVQILKDQLIHVQKSSLEKEAQLKEMEKFYQNQNSNTKEDSSENSENLHSKLKTLLKLLPTSIAAVTSSASSSTGNSAELRKICINLDSFICQQQQQQQQQNDEFSMSLKILCQNFRHLLKTVDDLHNRLEEYRLETEIARGEADKANDRADKLCKQYRDMIVQLADVKGKDSCARCSSVQFFDVFNTELKEKLDNEKYLYKNDSTPCINRNRRFVEYLIVQLKNICTKNCTDVEIMQHLRSILCGMLSDYDSTQRTISPLEFSGTESEIYGGDKSPILEHCSISSSSACSNSDQLSPANRFVDHHSSFEEDSLSDSGLIISSVSRQKRKTIKMLRRTRSVTFVDCSHVMEPPAFVKMETDFKDGRYKICWGSPATVMGAGGYRIYINGNVCKTISNILCTKTVVNCLSKIDLETLSITTFSRKHRYNESKHVTITTLH